jgi:hypothetical protein
MPMPKMAMPEIMSVVMKPMRVKEKEHPRHDQRRRLQKHPFPWSEGLLVSTESRDLPVDFRGLFVETRLSFFGRHCFLLLFSIIV